MSDKIKVLLVEDESSLAMIMKDTMEPTGMTVTLASDGEEGLRAFFADKPDVLVTDVMMPRMDGFEMVRRIRKQDQLTPVLFLTARSSVNDVVDGFKMGADDYLKKPFSLQELMVRVRRLAERSRLYEQPAQGQNMESANEWISIGDYRLNPTAQQLEYKGHVEELSHREAELMRMLAENINSVVESHDILMKLWGDDNLYNGRSLQVFITKLRHRLENDPRLRLVNVRGIGYKLILA
ncbi:MAG: response regulator transcription factor [Prevotella sp.]|jgi:two-component system response regulator TrcR